MTQKDTYLIENKKPVEMVYELKNEFPSFEEFVKTYEYDENVANSYEDEIIANGEVRGCGPCSYSYCPYSTPFEIEIYLEGTRWWARRRNKGTFLAGSWTWSPTNSYLYRDDLWMTDIDQARDVIPLLVNDDVYTANSYGLHSLEDDKFVNGALHIIRESIDWREKGGAVKVRETLNSNISKWTRYSLKLGASVGVGLVNPVAGMAIGAGAWGIGKLGEELCNDNRTKQICETVSDMGSGAFWGAALKGVEKGLVNEKGFCEFTKAHTSDAINAATEFAREAGVDGTWHGIHRAKGISHDPYCSICNS